MKPEATAPKPAYGQSSFVFTEQADACDGVPSQLRGDSVKYLTPEALMTYIQCQLSSLDGDIRKLMDQQKLNITKKEVLGKVEDAMKNPNRTFEEIDTALKNAIDALPEGDSLRTQLEQEFKYIHTAFSSDGLSHEQWAAETSKMHSAYENLNANAEMNMIELQSLMSQRQTAVQLTTSLLAKVDQTIQAILKNV